MINLFDTLEILRPNKDLPSIQGEQDDRQQEDVESILRWPKFTIRAKVIDDACCQLECIEPRIMIPHSMPSAVAVDSCRIVNIRSESSIVSPGIVSARVFFDLVVTYVDANGQYHTVTRTFAFPLEQDPAKMVSLPEADRDIHQTIVEVDAFCGPCIIEAAGRKIRCVGFLFICIKIGRFVQLVIRAKVADEPPECEEAETECPAVVPNYVRKKFGF